jgi:hypothetical protein
MSDRWTTVLGQCPCVAGSNVTQDPFAAFSLDSLEINENNLSTGEQRVVDGLQRSKREFEMVVCVADENQID